MLVDVWEASERCWHLPHLATRKLPAAAMDSLQSILSLVKVDTTESVYIDSCLRCQTIEEQVYRRSLVGFVAELDLALFTQPF